MFLRIIFLCLMIIPLQGCSSSHVLFQREGLSRNWIYIDFSRNKAPYENESEVGGEHMTFYKILGFEGDEFNVTVKTLEGEVSWGVMGDGVSVTAISGGDDKGRHVTVEDSEDIFTVDFSAHPYGRYKLTVEKLPRRNGEPDEQ